MWIAGSIGIKHHELLRRKLVDTPFPFPWAQAVSITLLLFCLSAPFLIVAFTTSIALSALMTGLTVHTYMMLNEARF